MSCRIFRPCRPEDDADDLNYDTDDGGLVTVHPYQRRRNPPTEANKDNAFRGNGWHRGKRLNITKGTHKRHKRCKFIDGSHCGDFCSLHCHSDVGRGRTHLGQTLLVPVGPNATMREPETSWLVMVCTTEYCFGAAVMLLCVTCAMLVLLKQCSNRGKQANIFKRPESHVVTDRPSPLETPRIAPGGKPRCPWGPRGKGT